MMQRLGSSLTEAWSVPVPDGCLSASPAGAIVETDFSGRLAVHDPDRGYVIAEDKLVPPGDSLAIPKFDADGGFRVVSGTSLRSYDRRGQLQWSRDLGAALNREPAVDPAGNAYVHSRMELHALGPDGKVLWSKPFAARGSWDAPAIASDGSVVTCDREGTVVAFRPEGTEAWRNDSQRTDQDDAMGLSPVRCAIQTGPDGSSYVLTTAGRLLALDQQGHEKWSVEARRDPLEMECPEVDGHGNIYLGRENELLAWDPQGTPLFSQTFPNPPHPEAAPDGGVAVQVSRTGIIRLDEQGREQARYPTDDMGQVSFLSTDDLLVQSGGQLRRLATPEGWSAWVASHPQEPLEIRQDEGSVTIGGIRLDTRPS